MIRNLSTASEKVESVLAKHKSEAIKFNFFLLAIDREEPFGK